MEYSTGQLYCLGIHTHLWAWSQQNKSDLWDIMVYHYEALPRTLYVLGCAENAKWRNGPSWLALRLVFTSDRVVVGVAIRSVEWCDLVKIKPTDSEAEHCIRLWLRRLQSSENGIVGVASRSGRVNHSQCPIRGLVIGWVFRFCLRLWQSSFHWIISDGVISGIGRKWKRSDSSDSDSIELMTPLTTPFFDFH